jgi:hypothetical protein
MSFKKLTQAVLAMAIVTTGQIAIAEKWQTIDHYQVKGGLVKDTKIGLMWMRCSLGQEWDGKTCTGVAKQYKWQEALDFAKKFSYAGYSDWRVPTIEELNTLVYCSNGNTIQYKQNGYSSKNGCGENYQRPTIVQAAFPNTPITWFCSSSPANNSSNFAWIVSFGVGGNGYNDNRVDCYAIRLVRSGQ